METRPQKKLLSPFPGAPPSHTGEVNLNLMLLPVWIADAIPIVPSPEHIHLFVIGGAAGRFSAFIPGWGHMSSPVLRSIEGSGNRAPICVDGTCYL